MRSREIMFLKIEFFAQLKHLKEKKYPKKSFIAVPLDDSSLREIKQMRKDHEVYLEIKANTFNLFFFKWKAENKKKERNFKVL